MFKLSFVFLFLIVINVTSVSSATWLPNDNCFSCGTYNQNYGTPSVNGWGMHSYYPMNYPNYWAHNYGMTRFNNYFYPGAWNHQNWGFNHHSYPGGGGMVAAKPNVYFVNHSKKEHKVKINLVFKNESNLLISSPAIEDWEGILQVDGSFRVNKAKYPYLFYDARYSSDRAQKEFGFCGLRDEITEYMYTILERNGFPNNARKDFAEFWPMKIPQSNYYCIYPQDDRHFSKDIDLIINSDTNVSKNRIIFHLEFIKNKELLPKKLKIYKHPLRDLASKNFIELFEWGVSMKTSQEKK